MRPPAHQSGQVLAWLAGQPAGQWCTAEAIAEGLGGKHPASIRSMLSILCGVGLIAAGRHPLLYRKACWQLTPQGRAYAAGASLPPGRHPGAQPRNAVVQGNVQDATPPRPPRREPPRPGARVIRGACSMED